MSLQAIRWAMEQRTGSATAKAVLLVLAEGANTSSQAFPSQQRIAEAAELGERTVRDALALLESKGLIVREARYRKGGSRKSNLYRLSIPAADAGLNPAPDAGMGGKEAGAAGMEGGIPAGAAALVPTVLEPTDIPPLSPKGETPPRGEEPEKPKRKRPFPLPDLWRPNEKHLQIGRERGVDVKLEAEKMRDWATAGGKRYLDWDATFRNWLRNSKPTLNGVSRRPPQPEFIIEK